MVANSHPNVSEPATPRMLTIAAGRALLTKEELMAKQSSPWFSIRMAHCHLILLSITHDKAQRQNRLFACFSEIANLPDNAIESALDYLAPFVPEHAKLSFENLRTNQELWRRVTVPTISATLEKVIVQRRRLVGVGVLAAGILLFLIYFSDIVHLGRYASAAARTRHDEPAEREPFDHRGLPPHLGTGNPFATLFSDDVILCTYRHHKPMKYQWLVHIDKKAAIVDFNHNQGMLSFLRNGSVWTEEDGTDPRNEFIIVVTSNKAPRSFPRLKSAELQVDGDDLKELQKEDDTDKRQALLEKILTGPFGGVTKASIRYTVYESSVGRRNP